MTLEKEFYDKLLADFLSSATNTNDHADRYDRNRNRVNYGSTVAYADILRRFGYDIDVPVYESHGYLRIPSITINGKKYKWE